MRMLDLFAGIGGFSLAGHWMGWKTKQFVEIDQFCQKVLSKNFPNVPIHDDVKTFDGRPFRGSIDIITGGFPCQPFSTAGKRKGTEDDRHLWPEMLRVIREVQPTYIVGENVYGLLNWSGGLVFEQVCTDLENEGYEVQPVILPACGVNAPHKRDRVWFVANRIGCRHVHESRETRSKAGENKSEGNKRKRVWCNAERISNEGTFTNPKCIGQQEQWRTHESISTKESRNWKASWSYNDGRWPTQSPVCGRNDGVSSRVDRLKALGNAIVPQVAYGIFKAITCS